VSGLLPDRPHIHEW